ncbi:hypothetical protein NQ318_018162 [Aromia moschata]|uniref:Uncharacterized protein n=1 Tax=Aromia moschata TaxID=1265417 RepID=A0AAV8ZCN0_9CUCU|nr:hypothetical protein NQ318_018162 [Aromia moschata]
MIFIENTYHKAQYKPPHDTLNVEEPPVSPNTGDIQAIAIRCYYIMINMLPKKQLETWIFKSKIDVFEVRKLQFYEKLETRPTEL